MAAKEECHHIIYAKCKSDFELVTSNHKNIKFKANKVYKIYVQLTGKLEKYTILVDNKLEEVAKGFICANFILVK